MRKLMCLSIRLFTAMIALTTPGLAQTASSPPGWPEPVHVAVTGNDYAFVETPTSLECATLCMQSSECQAYSYNASTDRAVAPPGR